MCAVSVQCSAVQCVHVQCAYVHVQCCAQCSVRVCLCSAVQCSAVQGRAGQGSAGAVHAAAWARTAWQRWPHWMKRKPARMRWKANLRGSAGRIERKHSAACSRRRAATRWVSWVDCATSPAAASRSPARSASALEPLVGGRLRRSSCSRVALVAWRGLPPRRWCAVAFSNVSSRSRREPSAK